MGEATLIASTAKLTRQQLASMATPLGTATHRPIPHADVIEALVETLGFRHIGVVHEEYAVSRDGMKMFGVLDLDTGMQGCRFSIGIRNSHDKNMRLAAVVGVRVLSVGADEMQRNFDPMRKQVESWRQSQLSDQDAKLTIYRAFIESDLEVPKNLARVVHDLYFRPAHPEFEPRTLWSRSNAFTSAFKQLEPIPQFKATAKLAGFLGQA